MEIGNGMALTGDGLEVIIDFFHGDIKEGVIVGGSNAPDFLFNQLAKKTELGKAYTIIRECFTTVIGLGANEVSNRATATQKKPSATEIDKSNESELKSLGN